jgi:hypothetical protein
VQFSQAMGTHRQKTDSESAAISVGKGVLFERVVKVIDACMRAEVTEISFPIQP